MYKSCKPGQNNQTLTVVNIAVENKSFFYKQIYTTLFNGPAILTISIEITINTLHHSVVKKNVSTFP